MGNEYKILTDHDGRDVYIGESSNQVEFYVEDPVEGTIALTSMMEPAKLLKGLMEGIKSVSYYMSEEEFNEVFSKLDTYPF